MLMLWQRDVGTDEASATKPKKEKLVNLQSFNIQYQLSIFITIILYELSIYLCYQYNIRNKKQNRLGF